MNDAAAKLAYLHQRKIGDCQRCELCKTRNTIVFGEGNPEADLMFVGEGPGGREDELGRPFVGRAGQLLDRWILHLGLKREDVFMANIIKCRPPQNRDPWEWEIQACTPYLRVQIAVIRPKVLVALGRFAGGFLSGERGAPMKALREMASARWVDEKSSVLVPVVAIYHPAYVLYQGGAGSRAEQIALADLDRARDLLA